MTDDRSTGNGTPGNDSRPNDGALSSEDLLRARLERLRAAAAQHQMQQYPVSPSVSKGQDPDHAPELEDYPYAPMPSRVGRNPEDGQPSLFAAPAEPPVPPRPTGFAPSVQSRDPAFPAPDHAPQEAERTEIAPAAPPAYHGPAEADVAGEPAPVRRVALLSEVRARESAREREEQDRRTDERRNLDRRSEPAFRNDPPQRPGHGGQPPGPRLIAENEGLVARNLGKQYKKRPVLRDVSLGVQRGEAVGLLGPNGAGKTTCFYIMIGLIGADYGEILLDGQDVTGLPMYRRARMGVGYLPQEASIFRGLTVEQNIRAILEAAEPDRDQREAMLEDLMGEFSITHLRRTPAIALSGGERRRLEIARALATRPHFILLDEPLAGIDPIAVRDIRDLVKHLKDRGLGVLITDHNVRETLDIVDRAYILHDGRVLMEGKPADIVANSEVRRVYLGDRFSL